MRNSYEMRDMRHQASNSNDSYSDLIILNQIACGFIRRLFYFCSTMHNIFFAILILLFISCTDKSKYTSAEDAQDAGRQFIRASLDGDYAKARFFLLKDSTNLFLIKQQQSNYEQMSDNEKRDYRESTIRPIQIISENDSVTLYRYYHTSNPKDTTTLRIKKENGEWLVDLKSFFDQKSH